MLEELPTAAQTYYGSVHREIPSVLIPAVAVADAAVAGFVVAGAAEAAGAAGAGAGAVVAVVVVVAVVRTVDDVNIAVAVAGFAMLNLGCLPLKKLA